MTAPIDGVASQAAGTQPKGPPATLPSDYDPSKADINGTDSDSAAASSLKLNSQSFLQLLVAQLKYQDPSNPVDTSKFMNQTAMLSQVQAMNSMKDKISDLVSAERTQSATNMVGKAVAFVDPDGNETSGVVDSVIMTGGSPMLQVDGYALPLAGVIQVANPVEAPANAPESGSGTDVSGSDGYDGTSSLDPGGGVAGDDAPPGTTGNDDTPDSAAPDTAAPDPSQSPISV